MSLLKIWKLRQSTGGVYTLNDFGLPAVLVLKWGGGGAVHHVATLDGRKGGDDVGSNLRVTFATVMDSG